MEKDVTVYECSFQLYVEKAIVSIKFPCIFFLQWKTTNGKRSAEGKCRPTSINSVVTFQEVLELNTELFFDNHSKQFTRKETIVNLNLISKSRQDQSKLVGRVLLDLANIANAGQQNEVRSHQLAYCSVDGQLFFSAVIKNKRKSTLNPQDLERSSFNQYVSFYTAQNRQLKTVREDRESKDEENNVGYGRKINQNAIDSHPNEFKISPRHHQTFFVLQSARQNSTFNLANQTYGASKQRSIGNETALTSFNKQQMPILPQITKDFGKINLAAKNTSNGLELDNINKYRDEIDVNKQKIGQMQKKMMELYINLQDSKRHIEFAQRQNREKEEIIKMIKESAKGQQQHQTNEWREKYQAHVKESSQEIKKYRNIQENLKKQIQQNQLNFQNLRKQTQQLRKIWTQKRQYYDEKQRKADDVVREKENKINDLLKKNEEMSKFKYQNQMLKALSLEKQSKIKLLEKDIAKYSEQQNEIRRNSLSQYQQNYKVKLQSSQSAKKIEEMTKQIQKYHLEVEKYRQNYIKIQTAYQIQTKNYDSAKEKYSHLENTVFALQKQNIQLKNSIQNSIKICQQTEKKYLQSYTNCRKIQSQNEQLKGEIQNLRNLNQSIKKQRDNLSALLDKQKIEEEVRRQDFQNQLNRMQTSFLNNLQHKQNSYNLAKKELQTNIVELKEFIACQQKQFNSKHQKHLSQLAQITQQLNLQREQIQRNLERIKILQQTIKDKQEIIKLSKQEIESLKSNNNQLHQSLTRMRETEKQLQENILILEEESQKIIYILEQKEETDREIENLKLQFNELLSQKSLLLQKYRAIEISFQEQKLRNAQLLKSIQQKEHEKQAKQQEIKILLLKIQETNVQNSAIREEWLESKTEIGKLKQIIREINERYEQHIKIQERYIQQINSIRQEKQEIEVIMNKNSNELVAHNQQLQNRISQLENAVQKYEACVESQHQERVQLQKERVQLQTAIQDSNRLQNQHIAKVGEFKLKVQFLQKQIQKHEKLKNRYEDQIQTLNNHLKQLQLQIFTLQTSNQQMNSTIIQQNKIIMQQNIGLKNYEQKFIQYKTTIQDKSNQIFQLQLNISELQNKMIHLQKKQNLQQDFIIEEIKPQSKSLFEGEHQFSQREQQLQQLLFQSDRKNEALQEKIMLLSAECQLSKQVKKEEHQQIYDSFNQFQREQMAKIIEEQRIEIDRIQSELKERKSTDATATEKRIVQLQTHIVQLESSFKAELDRILADQLQKQASTSINGPLSVINQQCCQEDAHKSQRSVVGSPSRVKTSFELVELYQLREKLQLMQEEKQQLEQQFYLMEQQKFNLLSTINQKDIRIEQISHVKALLGTEVEELRNELQNNLSKIKYLEYQVENLKNQLVFGSTINFNLHQNSVTRSEPILNTEDQQYSNKNVQIQNLKVEIEKLKNRQDELLWNIRDLEMQLETVTQNLNLLNGSTMNSVLNGSNKVIHSDDQKQDQRQKKRQFQEGYSKQRLLLELKKNEQLKQLAHNLIRVLKQRQKNQRQHEKVSKDMRSIPLKDQQYETINQKIAKLLNEFQTIKVYVMRSESGKLKEQANRLLGDMKNGEIMKNILIFEDELKSLRLANQQQLRQAKQYDNFC